MPITSIILLLAFVLYAWLIGYYRRAWISIPLEDGPILPSNPPFISVIIPARNEEAGIEECLESIVSQEYLPGQFECIVVDDHSEDDTAAVVRSYAARFPFIRYINLADEGVGVNLNAYKKKGIETGIAHSRGELIVTTDADCRAGRNWLAGIASAYRNHDACCLVMPVAIRKPGKGIPLRQRMLAIFQQLDVMTLQGITGASVYRKFHGMCNGANFAYTREVFYEVRGFTGIDHLASGDDMLLLHKISARYPERVHYVKSPSVIIETRAEKTTGDFFNQRIRWASKSGHYPDKRVLPVLLLVYIFNLLLLINILYCVHALIFCPENIALVTCLAVLLLKTIIELLFLIPVSRFFHQKQVLVWFPLMQVPHILYTVIAGFLGFLGRYRWKGRRVR